MQLRIECKNVMFNGIHWTTRKYLQKIWLGLVDYHRIASNQKPLVQVEMQCQDNVTKQIVGNKPQQQLIDLVVLFTYI